MYKYQVPILLEKNYDFSAVKSEKQKQLTEINGYDFSLIDVVQYLKKESKDFSEHKPLLDEIDKTIVKIVEDYSRESQIPNPFSEQQEVKAPTKEDYTSVIEGLEIQAELDPENPIYQTIIDGLKLQLELMD